MVREGEFATARPKNALLVGRTLGIEFQHWSPIPGAPLEGRSTGTSQHGSSCSLPGTLSLLSKEKTIS